MKPVHSQRLERWLGTERIEQLSQQMRGWYGPPIALLDVPGGVVVNGDGDFSGQFERGYFANAMDSLADYINRVRISPATLGVGFTSISDALVQASSGNSQTLSFAKNGGTGVVAGSNTLWRLGASPVAGAVGSAAPAGRAPTSATTGAMPYNNPASGTLHLTGADVASTIVSNSLLLYDRLFDVAKTINSTATEAVSGVPTRYQSTVLTNPDSAAGNFLFVEVGGTAMAGTNHNWTVCTYTNQAGNAATVPSFAGINGAIADRLDHAGWFAPLASGDTGIRTLTQMQCSAAVATGSASFVIGHPLGVMAMPVANMVFPFDWLTNRSLAPRIFDNACLALMEMTKPATTATTYTGQLYLTRAA